MSNILSSMTLNISKYLFHHHLNQDEASITLITKPDKDIMSIDTYHE